MVTSQYDYAIVYRNLEGGELGQQRVNPDWGPLRAGLELKAARCGHPELLRSSREALVTVEPVPQAPARLPYCSGFRGTLRVSGTDPHHTEHGISHVFPAAAYFKESARRGAARLVADGVLAENQQFLYQVLAYPSPTRAALPPGVSRPDFEVEELDGELPLTVGRLDVYRQQSVPFGRETASDLPVFVPQQVIDEMSALTVEAGRVETGGILIGRLIYDASGPEVGVVVTAQIPARLAEGEQTKLTFTPQTWAAVDAAMALRKTEDLLFQGLWHSHPARWWCAPQCPPERRRVCPLTVDFFSTDDVQMFRTVFPKAFHVAHVVTHTDDGLRHALFGYRDGVVAQRGFHIMPSQSQRPPALIEAVASVEGDKAYAKEVCH
jgi:hypothetical protein